MEAQASRKVSESGYDITPISKETRDRLATQLTDEEREQIERAKAGEFNGLLTWHQDEKGSWVRS